MNEIETLKQAIRFAELEDQRRMLRGQLAFIGYLRTQPAPVDKDRILKEVRLRHVIVLKALHHSVQDGRVMRTGSGKRGDGYRYGVAATRNDEECVNADPAPVSDPTETPEPHLRWKVCLQRWLARTPKITESQVKLKAPTVIAESICKQWLGHERT